MNIFFQTLSDFPPIKFTKTEYIIMPTYFVLNFHVNVVLVVSSFQQLKLIYKKLILENPIYEPISSFGLLVSDPYKSDNVGLAWRDVLYLAWFQTLTHPQIRGVARLLDWVIWFVGLPFYVCYVYYCLLHDHVCMQITHKLPLQI